MGDKEYRLEEAIEEGCKKFEAGAFWEKPIGGGRRVEVSVYWASTVARIDIKGLR